MWCVCAATLFLSLSLYSSSSSSSSSILYRFLLFCSIYISSSFRPSLLCQARTRCSLTTTRMLSPLPVWLTRNGSLKAQEARSATCNERTSQPSSLHATCSVYYISECFSALPSSYPPPRFVPPIQILIRVSLRSSCEAITSICVFLCRSPPFCKSNFYSQVAKL